MKKLCLILIGILFPVFLQAQVTLAEKQGMPTDVLALQLDTFVQKNLPKGAYAGIMAYDLTSGKLLYAHDADKLCRPASNMKLLTSITALSLPQSESPFRTEVWYQGEIVGDTLHGNVYVVGGFDPEFDEEALMSFTDAVDSLHVKVIDGLLIGDVSAKDSLYWGTGWIWDDNPGSYQPYLSPLMLNKGVVNIEATAGNAGEPAMLEVTPYSSFYSVHNQTVSKTASAGKFKVDRNWLENDNQITVSGNVARKSSGSVNVYNSNGFFMHTWNDQLRKRGIEVTGGYDIGELMKNDSTYLLASFETPMQDVLNQMMKESDNLNAEAMLWRIGAQSTGKKHVSAEDCLEVVKSLIGKMGLKATDYRLADGCGLSNYDYLSPELLVAFLKYAYNNKSIYRRLNESLPIGGIDGTLKNRMGRGTPSFRVVHAKTGSITGVYCLSGYLKNKGGHDIAFAIMNQNGLSATTARRFQDKLCDLLITLSLD